MSSEGGIKAVPAFSFEPSSTACWSPLQSIGSALRLTIIEPSASSYRSQSPSNLLARAGQARRRDFWDLSGLSPFDLIPFVGCAPERMVVPVDRDGGNENIQHVDVNPVPQDRPVSPTQNFCICGNRFSFIASEFCPPLSGSILDQFLNERIETILNYASMTNVRRFLEIDCRILPAISRLLRNYDPCLSIDELDRRFDTIFRGLGLSDYCSPSSPSVNRMTPEFLKNLVHALYLEVNHIVPWSLHDYDSYQIEFLLPTNCHHSSLPHPQFIRRDDCEITNEDREPYRIFPLARSSIRSDQQATAQEVIREIPLRFAHQGFWEGHSHDVTYQSADYRSVCSSSSPGNEGYLPLTALFRERNLSDGCWAASSLSATYLRSLNIPARLVSFTRPEDPEYNNGRLHHGVLWLPSLDLYSHGDWLAVGHAGTPGELLLYSWERFHETARNVISTPYGVRDAFLGGANLWRTSDNLLYVSTRYLTTTSFEKRGFDGNIDHPLPIVMRMLENIRRVYPSARFQQSPQDPSMVDLISDPVPIESLDELRENACRR